MNWIYKLIFLMYEVKKEVSSLQAPEIGLLAPDLVLYLDIPPEVIFNTIFIIVI